ncbi:cupin domain-containing protein [Streptomyces sp. NPDC005438]|uniref:cupin domain-containing protein n=1 Tax=Streptomyces sp. NPDC005438 TaxID=3156880 RepID=UPI0033AF9167
MTVIRASQTRRTVTPNAAMTTLASPTQGGASLSVWEVHMEPGSSGPTHRCDVPQVWVIQQGAARVELGAEELAVEAGDTLLLPPEEVRRVWADPHHGMAALVSAPAGGQVWPWEESGWGDPVVPPWMA